MEYRKPVHTGLEVAPLCIGYMGADPSSGIRPGRSTTKQADHWSSTLSKLRLSTAMPLEGESAVPPLLNALAVPFP